MSKRYIHTVDDDSITNNTEFMIVANLNPPMYPVGAVYVLTNGTMLVVTVNGGTSITSKTVTVT